MKCIISIAAVAILFGVVTTQKLINHELEKNHQQSLQDFHRQLTDSRVPIDLQFTSSPYIYTGNFTFGSNKQEARLRFTTDSDWTMITGQDCYRCVSRAYNQSLSTSVQNGTYFHPQSAVGDLKWAGTTVKDTVCVGHQASPCVSGFEFFVIANDTAERSELQRCDGIMGLAPDEDDNGPSYMTSLRNLTLIDKLQISFLMNTEGKSTMTFGGYDPALMKPYPSASNRTVYWYSDRNNDEEWGTEMRNIIVDGVSIDDGNLTYAKIDPLSNFIKLPIGYYLNYLNYMSANHTEMPCSEPAIGFGMCYGVNITCESIISNYTDILIRFNDTNAFVVPPKSYLKTEMTSGGIPICYNMIIGSVLDGPNTVVLGDVFMENYLVVYDFQNSTIGLNGFVIESQPIEPVRPPFVPQSNTTMIIIIVAVAVVALAGAIGIYVLIKKRNSKLQQNLKTYGLLESETTHGGSDIYQKPSINQTKGGHSLND